MPTPNLDHLTTDPEYIDLLNYLIKRTKNVELPKSIKQLLREFKEKSETLKAVACLERRVEKLRTHIHSFKHIDRNTKVKVLFALSASVNADFLEELRKNAFVQVDENNRIVYYKAIDGSLNIRRDHSQSAKYRTAHLETKHCLRSLIRNYFKNKNNVDAVPKNKKEEEMWNLIEFITEKCETTDSPLSIGRLAKDFNTKLESPRSLDCIEKRVKSYRYEIQKTEFLDTPSKVRQLFGLSVTLDSACLKEFRKNALVEVDDQNRITKYTGNDGCLTLHGDHSPSAKRRLAWVEWKNKRNAVKKYCNFEDDDDDNETPIRYHSSSSKRTRPYSDDSMRRNELDDYDTNYSIEDQVKLEPFRGSIQDDFNEIERDEDIQRIPKPLQAYDEHNQLMEVPIKTEVEEPVEVKPEISHNPKIKFFEAMHSVIDCLDTPSLSWIQSKIHQKIQKLGGPNEVILNNEIVLIIELLISRMTNHSVENHSENVESVNLSSFLCYLKAAIQNSKMSGIGGLVKKISNLIEKLHKKRIPMRILENSLRSTLDIDGF